jgi:hypothetical protein
VVDHAAAVVVVVGKNGMNSRVPYELVTAAPGSAADHRQKVLRAAQERAAERDRELESQASSIKDPRERIEIWERLHALHLPRAPGHVLVKVIARQTRLTVGQVHAEQQRRAGTLELRPT